MSSPDISILGLCGSLRASYTLRALEIVLAAARDLGARTEILCGEEMRLPLCDRIESEPPLEIAPLWRRVREAGVLVLATPEYCGTCSAVIKNAVEWLAPEGLTGKVVGLLSVAEGPTADGSLNSLRELCLRQCAWVVPVPAALPMVSRVFQAPEAPFSRLMLEPLTVLGRTLPDAARRLAGWTAATLPGSPPKEVA